MKLIATESERFTFGMDGKEKALFLEALEAFPLVPPEHHRLSKAGAVKLEDQQLLEQTLSEQRKQHKIRVQIFLAEPLRFQGKGKQIRLNLNRDEIDWLLQVLNDVRVGAWLALGSPEQIHSLKLIAKNPRYLFAMEMSGYFQVHLLAALGYDEPSFSE